MPIKWPYLLCLILIFFTSCYLFYPRIENFFVFFPESNLDLTPEEMNLSYRDVYINKDDGKILHGWFFPLKGEYPVILFCHGNAGNISHRLDNIRRLLEYDLQVFIFDYRGYGKSSGRPTEKGLYLDGLAAYDYLVHKAGISPGNIIPFGRSLGAAVAIEISLKRSVRSIILESAFTSTNDMAKNMFLFNLFSRVLPHNYNNLKKIADIHVPKLIIHGEDDEIVPFSMGWKLFDTSGPPKSFLKLNGAGHNDTYLVGGERYFESFAFFARESRI